MSDGNCTLAGSIKDPKNGEPREATDQALVAKSIPIVGDTALEWLIAVDEVRVNPAGFRVGSARYGSRVEPIVNPEIPHTRPAVLRVQWASRVGIKLALTRPHADPHCQCLLFGKQCQAFTSDHECLTGLVLDPDPRTCCHHQCEFRLLRTRRAGGLMTQLDFDLWVPETSCVIKDCAPPASLKE
ncbi:hypothetical protein B0H10DRAFT_1940609 [Mycena sp. CBHHK59/15]|nr:hypothetical protein B0H10DRAFT_1940609 [Mycena sp. CBHHK59/15]